MIYDLTRRQLVTCPECRGDKCIALRDEQTGKVLHSSVCPRCDGFGVVDAADGERGGEDERQV